MPSFADYMVIFRNSKELAKVARISEFSKFVKYKIKIQKSTGFLYTSNEQSENESLFTIASILRNEFNKRKLKH